MIKTRPYKIDEFLSKYPFGTVITIKLKSSETIYEYTGAICGYSYVNFNKEGHVYKTMRLLGMSKEVDSHTDADCYHISIGHESKSLQSLFDEFVIIEDGQEKTIGVECETNQNVF